MITKPHSMDETKKQEISPVFQCRLLSILYSFRRQRRLNSLPKRTLIHIAFRSPLLSCELRHAQDRPFPSPFSKSMPFHPFRTFSALLNIASDKVQDLRADLIQLRQNQTHFVSILIAPAPDIALQTLAL